MGYTHGKRWVDGEIEEKIRDMVKKLNLDHFPTKTEMIDFYGDSSLTCKISKSGGSRYYASKLNLRLADCESEFGNYFEELAIDEILENTGFLSLHTNVKYPYDLLTNGNIKVDVKVSKKVKNKNANMPYHSFNLEKREPTCDLFVFYCLDDEMEIEKRVIIPSCLLSGKTQVGIGGLSKWDAYIDKWEYFDMYSNFYETVKSTAINLPKRRTLKPKTDFALICEA
jgi:hypothetical protein